MDNENIASILKDAIHASSSQIQAQSKRAKLFVLPPELLKGLLVKNETPQNNSPTETETSSSKNNRKTTTNKRQSVKNSKSPTLLVDRPRRARKQSTANKSPKNARSQNSSKRNPKDLVDIEQNYKQKAILENNEAPDTLQSVDKITIQKKSNRGRKAKTKIENEPSDSSNIEKSFDTEIPDKSQEECVEINHEFNEYSTTGTFDKPLDNDSKDKCTTRLSVQIEENCISSNVISDNNLSNIETVASNSYKTSYDTIKVTDTKTESIAQVLQDPHIEILQSDASQKILNGEITSDVELNDETGVNVPDTPIQLSNKEQTAIIEEETYIVEEIIEIVGSDEDNTVERNSDVDIFEKEINTQTDNVLPVKDINLSIPNSASINIKTEPVTENLSSNFELTVKQKASNAIKVYVNKRKSRKQPSSNEVQEKYVQKVPEESSLQIDSNFDQNSLDYSVVTEKPITNSDIELECARNILEKYDSEVEYHFSDNIQHSLTTTPVTEIFVANQCQEIDDSKKVLEQPASDIDCNHDKNCLPEITSKEITTASVHETLEYSEKVQENLNLKIDHQNNYVDTGLTEETSDVDLCNEFIQEKSLEVKECNIGEDSSTNIVQEQTNSEKVNQTSLDTIETETFKVIREANHEGIVSGLENDITNSIEKIDSEDNILEPAEKLDVSLHNREENTDEIQNIESVERTDDTHEKVTDQPEHVQMKTSYKRSRRKSSNARDMKSSSKTTKFTNVETEIDAQSAKNTESSELAKHSSNNNLHNNVEKTSNLHNDVEQTSNLHNDVEQTTTVSVNKDKTNISCNNNDLGKTKDYWQNEENSSIKSLRQLRNRTKVVPQDPENYNIFKYNIEKESLHLQNRDKSDIIVRNNYEVSNRARSTSLNLEPNNSDKVSSSAKKLSRKPNSTDNYLRNAATIITLRRRSTISENQSKLSVDLEESNKISNKESSSSQIQTKNSSQSIASKDIADNGISTIPENSESTVMQKTDEMITPGTNLNENDLSEKLNYSTGDFQNPTLPTEITAGNRRSSLKPEKVIVVRKIKKGRHSKSFKPKDDSAVTTDLGKTDNNSTELDDYSKVTDNTVSCDNVSENNLTQIEIPKIADNKILSEESEMKKINDTSIDSSNCQENISFEELKIKKEKVIPVRKSRRGTFTKPTKNENSREVAVINKLATSVSQKDENTSNIDSEMENALDSSVKIKTEKITPVKRGRKGKRSQSNTSKEIVVESCRELESTNSSNNGEDAITNNTITDKTNLDNASECMDSSVKIKTDKITPVKRGKKGKRPQSNTSKEIVVESCRELETANSLNNGEDATTNNKITDESNLDNASECIRTATSIADRQMEIEENSLKIKTEKVSPLKRGIRGNNIVKEEHTKEVSENISPQDDVLTNHVIEPAEISENVENVSASHDLGEKSKCNATELSEADYEMEKCNAIFSYMGKKTPPLASTPNSSKRKNKKLPRTKKGRKGRPPRSFQTDISTNENEGMSNACITSSVKSNADLQKDNITQSEDDDNGDHVSNLDNIGVTDEIKEAVENPSSNVTRRSSRRVKQELPVSITSDDQIPCKDAIEKTKRYSKWTSKTNVQSYITDTDDELKDLPNVSVRKSGRHKKSNVNYRVPDEDVDVFDSEAPKQEPSENVPKKRRGRPSTKEALKLNASVEENLEQNLQESVQNTGLDTTANDLDLPPADIGNTPTRPRRSTKKSTINEDIFEVESKPAMQEKSAITPNQDEGETLSDVGNNINDFEDSHFSDAREEEEDSVEEHKPRRGRKRKNSFIECTLRKRGRPPKKRPQRGHDEEYTPHHSYVARPTKLTEMSKKVPDKKTVKCGKCQKEIPRNQWYSHNLYAHNDMGWLDGTEKPDFENDQKLLIRILSAAHKKKHNKGLVCEACRELKKSVMGFISHTMFCGKTEEEIESLMITCELCGGKFKPASMEYHERQHRLDGEVKRKREEKAKTLIDIFEPRSKRKAAEMAVSKISEFTALVKDDDGLSAAKKLKISSPHFKKIIQKPLAKKKISSFTIAKWKRELENNQDTACTQLGCQFTCKSLDEMREHYSSCNFTVTENYLCKVCGYETSFEDEIIKHAAEKHTSEDFDANAMASDTESSDSEIYSEIEEEDSSIKGRKMVKEFFYKETPDQTYKMFKFLFHNGACHTILNQTFLHGFQWTLEFERKHFQFNIFNEYMSNNFTLLDGKDAESYLPEVDLSMPVRFMKTDNRLNVPEWKNWTRFEGSCVEGCPTFFVGGPVWAMAWAPTPTFLAISDDLPQFLAVSTHPTMDVEYSVGQSYSGKNIIQIWNVGKLNNRNTSESDPELSYAIAHDGGTVWSLEWCPSGCYQREDFPFLKGEKDSNRLGLLAAGCSDGSVRIYSLVFPEDLHSSNENQYPIYKAEPIVKLIINSDMYDSNSQTWQVTKLCWSRESNHNVVVAGLSNGYVAFWNLATKSPLLKYKVDNTTFIRPYKQFFAHHHAVTMLALVAQDNKRYIVTASLDKLYKFWDMHDLSKPRNTYKKSYVTNGAWLNNWCCAILVHDDALCMSSNSTVCLPLRNYTYKYYNLLPSNSTTYGVATSDFGNSVATGNVAGELLVLFPHQLLYFRDLEKIIPPKRNYSLISTTELVDFQAESAKKDKKSKKGPYSCPTDYLPSTYKDSKTRFGIQFNNNMNLFENHLKKTKQKPKGKQTLNCEHLEKVAIEQYPLKSINKVAWNPNASSFLWLAAGYQNGFVRLVSFNSIASNTEWNKLLQSYTDALKTQMTNAAAEDEC